MRATRILLGCLVFLSGCSRTEAPFRGYRRASGDVVKSVMEYAMRYGARPVNTNDLPKIETEWRYRTDVDGVQFYLRGDHFPEVQSFLLTAFGPPAIPAQTNADGKFLGVYAAPVTGAAIQFGREDGRDGARYTTILIVGEEGLKR